VVVPRDVDDVVAAVAVCRDHGVPILGRGGGTSLAGQCCNVAVVLDFTKYLNGIVELDPERRLARVEPGIYRDRLDQAAAVHGLTFGPDLATHGHCAIGGMVGNNACGAHAQMAGRMAENAVVAQAARSRASTATASPAPSCCPSCTARSWCGPSGSSRRCGTRAAG
jgi:FAD/FMN-containing dehydrogenase